MVLISHCILTTNHWNNYLVNLSNPCYGFSQNSTLCLTLAAYQYTIKHKPGTSMLNADGLSRLPLKCNFTDSQVPLPGDLCHLLNHLDQSIVTASQIKVWTDKDPLLSQVRKLVQNGWNITEPTPDLAPLHNQNSELSVLDGCLLLG